MSKPLVIFDPWPRRQGLIFTEAQWHRLNAMAEIVAHEDGRMPDAVVDGHLGRAAAVIGQTALPRARLDAAPGLRAVINVEGNFLQNIDYETCFSRGIPVLSIAPAFALPVAEAALAMALDLARGITAADRAMREGREEYGFLSNRESFLLTGAEIGLIGFGNLGRALLPLLAPFRGRVLVHDPWLPDGFIRAHHAEPCDLDTLLRTARVVFVLAGVTSENTGFLDRTKLSLIRRDAVVVLASRAAVIDFASFVALADEGAFRAATDVFPAEPVSADDPVRRSKLLLSSHRAGGIPQAFATIGEMVVEDLDLILRGLPPARLQPAQRETVMRARSIAGRSYQAPVSL